MASDGLFLGRNLQDDATDGILAGGGGALLSFEGGVALFVSLCFVAAFLVPNMFWLQQSQSNAVNEEDHHDSTRKDFTFLMIMSLYEGIVASLLTWACADLAYIKKIDDKEASSEDPYEDPSTIAAAIGVLTLCWFLFLLISWRSDLRIDVFRGGSKRLRSYYLSAIFTCCSILIPGLVLLTMYCRIMDLPAVGAPVAAGYSKSSYYGPMQILSAYFNTSYEQTTSSYRTTFFQGQVQVG